MADRTRDENWGEGFLTRAMLAGDDGVRAAARERIARAEWNEEDHPRDGGKFAPKGGGGGAASGGEGKEPKGGGKIAVAKAASAVADAIKAAANRGGIEASVIIPRGHDPQNAETVTAFVDKVGEPKPIEYDGHHTIEVPVNVKLAGANRFPGEANEFDDYQERFGLTDKLVDEVKAKLGPVLKSTYGVDVNDRSVNVTMLNNKNGDGHIVSVEIDKSVASGGGGGHALASSAATSALKGIAGSAYGHGFKVGEVGSPKEVKAGGRSGVEYPVKVQGNFSNLGARDDIGAALKEHATKALAASIKESGRDPKDASVIVAIGGNGEGKIRVTWPDKPYTGPNVHGPSKTPWNSPKNTGD